MKKIKIYIHIDIYKFNKWKNSKKKIIIKRPNKIKIYKEDERDK